MTAPHFFVRRRLETAAVVAVLGLILGLTISGAAAQQPSPPATGAAQSGATPGAAGVGDRYFPSYGNGGYQVRHYGVDVAYTPRTGRLNGTTVVTARTKKALSSFHLDLMLRPIAVRVDGSPAAFSKPTRHELVVVPRRPVAAHRRMVVRVTYTGFPGRVNVPSHIPGAGRYAPWQSPKLESFVNGAPEGAAVWFPVNDHPVDKARYDITAHAPRTWEAVSNGRLVSHRRTATESIWHWRQPTPMVSYLAFLGLGQYQIRQGTTAGGRPFTYAWSDRFGPKRAAKALATLRTTPRRVDWLSRQFGRYPFRHVGGVVVDANISTIESQTAPVYNGSVLLYGRNASTLMTHELAHQWFGDSVSIRRWRDVWLNEGFATWSEWLYAARHGGPALNRQLTQLYRMHPAGDAFWNDRTANPGPHSLWGPPVYDRGAMTAQALRNVVGARTFDPLVRTWLASRAHGHGTTRQFVALSQRVSDQDLTHFFHVWLHTAKRPAWTTANGLPKP
ncbi:MAG: M1 family metallopeptidase [Nocardioidaceae bacterium]